MFLALNNQKLLVRDIQNFSKENPVRHKKPERSFFSLLKSVAKSLMQIVTVSFQLKLALKLINTSMKNDYKKFSVASDREKEDILIKWEGLGITLNKHSGDLPATGSSIFTKGIVRKSNEIVNTVNDFIDNLKGELYPNINQPLSQEYLQRLSKKFGHLPKEMLEDLISDEQMETI